VILGLLSTFGRGALKGNWRDDLLSAALMSIALFYVIRSQLRADRTRRRKEAFRRLAQDLRPRRRAFRRKKSA
jgi:hypothetical protein